MRLDVVDRLDITDLYARYCLAFDDGEATRWAGLFTTDGAFFITAGPTIRGSDALAGFAARAHARTPGIRHLVSNIALEATAAGARGTAYVVVLGAADDGALRVLTLGRYEDEFVPTGDGWRFRTRTYIPWVPADSTGPAFIGPLLATGA